MNSHMVRRKPVPSTTKNPVYHTIRAQSPARVDSDGKTSDNKDTATLSLFDRLVIAAVVFGGTLVLLGAVAYLSFLWFGGPSRSAWKLIVLSNWIATSVAICGLAIRWTTSFQMILCTSIIAWNMLKAGSPLSKIVRLSTLRYNNSGPLDIIILRPFILKAAFCSQLFLLTVVGTMIAVLLQLSSTLLLSDIKASPVETFKNSSSRPVLSDEPYNAAGNDFYTDALLTTSPSYPLFAELPQDAVLDYGKTVDDTGPMFRALLPVPAEDGRAQLLSYEGKAALYDARVTCTAPDLSNLTLTGGPLNLQLTGKVNNHSTLIPSMVFMNGSGTDWFNLSISETRGTGSAWTIFTWDLTTYRQGLVNGLDTVYDPATVHKCADIWDVLVVPYDNSYKDTYYGYTSRPVGQSWLVINITDVNASPWVQSSHDEGDMRANTYLSAYAFNDSNAWTISMPNQWARISSDQADGLRSCTYYYGPSTIDSSECHGQTVDLGAWTPKIDISLCSSAFPYTKTLYIDAYRLKATQEPITLEAGIAQIGVGKARGTLEGRGIMQLNKTTILRQLSDERDQILQEHLQSPVLPVSRLLSFNPFYGGSFVVPPGLRSWYPGDSIVFKGSDWHRTSEGRAALFQRIVQETNSPALAIQSMIHTYITDRYYKYRPFYENTTTQWLVYEVNAIQPVRARGFIAVMVGIVVHFLWLTYIFLAYGVPRGLNHTLRSIDQAWQATAQVALLLEDLDNKSAATVTTKEEERAMKVFSTMVTDNEVDQCLKARKIKDQVFVLDDRCNDGVIQFKPSSTPD